MPYRLIHAPLLRFRTVLWGSTSTRGCRSVCAASTPKTEAFVPWVSLQGQFGTNYRSIRKFRQVFLKTLRDVLTQYPQAQLRPNSKGLHLRQSPPPISRKELCA